MVIAPKNPFKRQPFVDREGHIQIFKENVYNIGQKKFSILVYYGVAGIGKTSLRKEFPKHLEKHNKEYQYRKTVWASIDFRLEKHREKNTFLVSLKNELQKEHKIHFPAFEIAHAIYWKKANPEIPLRKENYLFFEGDNAFDDYFGVVEKIPYFSIVPATARLLKNLPNYFRKWWTKKGEEELLQLSEKEPLEIEETLPYFWAQDLNNFLEYASKSAVLFIDTYEALWENHRSDGHSRDEWIREELIPLLPRKVLWVISGKEALKWEEIDCEWNEYFTQYKVEGLLEDFCIKYLETQGISDKEIQEAIFKGSKGIPYYLELSADTYEKVVRSRKPEPKDFGNDHQEIADRFFKFLTDEEKNALNVLSIPHFWDYDLFEYMMREFNTGYPTTNYEDLCSFSFIGKDENNRYQMHQLMQESLQKTQEKKKPDSVKRIHKAAHEYYSSKLENIDIKSVTSENEIALVEALYHAKNIMKTKELLSWLNEKSKPFCTAACWRLVYPIYENLLQNIERELGSESIETAIALDNLSTLYNRIGYYKKALQLCQKSLGIYEKILGSENSTVVELLNNLGVFLYCLGDYENAIKVYQQVMEINNKMEKTQALVHAATLSNLAELYRTINKYEEAIPLYRQAIEIHENNKEINNLEFATILNNFALLYVHMGNFRKSLPLYEQALNIRENLLGKDHPSVANTLSSLAGLHSRMGKREKALLLYERALEIRENKLGEAHPDIAETLSNLAGLFVDMADYKKALHLYERALNMYINTLGEEHLYVAITLNDLGLLYTYKGEYEKALHLYERALYILKKAVGDKHREVATTLNNLAALYEHMGMYEKALSLCEKSLTIREDLLGKDHYEVAVTLNSLASIYHHMGKYDEGLVSLERALDIIEIKLGMDHPNFETTMNNLLGLYNIMLMN